MNFALLSPVIHTMLSDGGLTVHTHSTSHDPELYLYMYLYRCLRFHPWSPKVITSTQDLTEKSECAIDEQLLSRENQKKKISYKTRCIHTCRWRSTLETMHEEVIYGTTSVHSVRYDYVLVLQVSSRLLWVDVFKISDGEFCLVTG